jgi:hypothetical protein
MYRELHIKVYGMYRELHIKVYGMHRTLSTIRAPSLNVFDVLFKVLYDIPFKIRNLRTEIFVPAIRTKVK